MLLLAAILATEKPMGELPTFGTGCTLQSRLLQASHVANAVASEPGLWHCADRHAIDALDLYVSQDQQILAAKADTDRRGQRCLDRHLAGRTLGEEPLPDDHHWGFHVILDRDARSLRMQWLPYGPVPD